MAFPKLHLIRYAAAAAAAAATVASPAAIVGALAFAPSLVSTQQQDADREGYRCCC